MSPLRPTAPRPGEARAWLNDWLAPIGLREVMLLLIALGGWGTYAFDKLFSADVATERQQISYTEDVLSTFQISPGYRAYSDLATALKPWWDEIRPLQTSIMETGDDARKAELIAERDQSLITFLKTRELTAPADSLIRSFERFSRCLDTDLCHRDLLRRSIEIDVKLIYRTFRPYIRAVRERGGVERSFGRGLETLYYDLVG